MSTATATPQHRPHTLALVAASAVVVLGGLTAIGVAASQDSTTSKSPSVSTSPNNNQMCPDNRCLPQSQQQSGAQGSAVPPLKGGHVMMGMP